MLFLYAKFSNGKKQQEQDCVHYFTYTGRLCHSSIEIIKKKKSQNPYALIKLVDMYMSNSLALLEVLKPRCLPYCVKPKLVNADQSRYSLFWKKIEQQQYNTVGLLVISHQNKHCTNKQMYSWNCEGFYLSKLFLMQSFVGISYKLPFFFILLNEN